MTAHVELWFVSLHGWRVDWEWTWPGVSWTGFRVCVVCWFSKLYLCPDPPRPRWAFPEHGWTSSATVFVLFVGGTLCTSSPVGLTRTKCRFSRGGHPVLRWTLHATKGEENILILPNIWRYKMNRDCFSICCWTLLFFFIRVSKFYCRFFNVSELSTQRFWPSQGRKSWCFSFYKHRAKRVPWVFGFLLGQREQRTIENSALSVGQICLSLSLHPNSPKPHPKHTLCAAVCQQSPASAAKSFSSSRPVQFAAVGGTNTVQQL